MPGPFWVCCERTTNYAGHKQSTLYSSKSRVSKSFSGAPPSHPPLPLFLDEKLQLLGRKKVTKTGGPDLSKQGYLFTDYMLSFIVLA